MPPFIPATCPHCFNENTFDKATLDGTDSAVKSVTYRGAEPANQEYKVTCVHCQKDFKLKLKGGRNG